MILSHHQLSHSFERRNLSLFLAGCQGPHGRVKIKKKKKVQLTVESLHLVKGFSAQIAEIILCIPKTLPVIQRDEFNNKLGFMPDHLSALC